MRMHPILLTRVLKCYYLRLEICLMTFDLALSLKPNCIHNLLLCCILLIGYLHSVVDFVRIWLLAGGGCAMEPILRAVFSSLQNRGQD